MSFTVESADQVLEGGTSYGHFAAVAVGGGLVLGSMELFAAAGRRFLQAVLNVGSREDQVRRFVALSG